MFCDVKNVFFTTFESTFFDGRHYGYFFFFLTNEKVPSSKKK